MKRIQINPMPARTDSRAPVESLLDDQRAMFVVELSSVDATTLAEILNNLCRSYAHDDAETMNALLRHPRRMEADDPRNDVTLLSRRCECPSCMVKRATLERVLRVLLDSARGPAQIAPPSAAPRQVYALPPSYPETPFKGRGRGEKV